MLRITSGWTTAFAMVGVIALAVYFGRPSDAVGAAGVPQGTPRSAVQAAQDDPEPMACPLCSGSGKVSCDHCLGTGELPGTGNPYVDPPIPPAQCPICGGTGEKTCPECHGTGTVIGNNL